MSVGTTPKAAMVGMSYWVVGTKSAVSISLAAAERILVMVIWNLPWYFDTWPWTLT